MAQQGISQIRVIVTIVTRGGGDSRLSRRAAFDASQNAPVFLRLGAPCAADGNAAVAQVVLLRIEGALEEGARRPVQHEPRGIAAASMVERSTARNPRG